MLMGAFSRRLTFPSSRSSESPKMPVPAPPPPRSPSSGAGAKHNEQHGTGGRAAWTVLARAARTRLSAKPSRSTGGAGPTPKSTIGPDVSPVLWRGLGSRRETDRPVDHEPARVRRSSSACPSWAPSCRRWTTGGTWREAALGPDPAQGAHRRAGAGPDGGELARRDSRRRNRARALPRRSTRRESRRVLPGAGERGTSLAEPAA